MTPFWTRIFGEKEPTVRFCEVATDSILARPWSFVSNLPFFVVGALLLTKHNIAAKSIGVASILVGFGSSLYDASFRFNAQILDLSMMMILLNVFLYFPIQSVFKNTRLIIGLLTANQLLYLFLILFVQGRIGQIWYALVIVMYLAIEGLRAISRRSIPKDLIAGVGIFAIATGIWYIDSVLTICPEQDWLSGRPIFHVLVPLSIYCVYRHINRHDIN